MGDIPPQPGNQLNQSYIPLMTREASPAECAMYPNDTSRYSTHSAHAPTRGNCELSSPSTAPVNHRDASCHPTSHANSVYRNDTPRKTVATSHGPFANPYSNVTRSEVTWGPRLDADRSPTRGFEVRRQSLSPNEKTTNATRGIFYTDAVEKWRVHPEQANQSDWDNAWNDNGWGSN